MDEQYVDLTLIKYRMDTLSREEQQLSTHSDIFKYTTGCGTLYLTGEPGVGKSTFVARMCVDWANLHVKDAEVNQQPTFKFNKFPFVLPVFLRAVKPGQTLREVFTEEYRIENGEAKSLCRYIESNQEDIFLVLDGLDEYNEQTSTEITDLVHKRLLPHVNRLITSRHPSSSVFSVDKKPDIELSLRGFSATGVKEYVTKFYKEKKDEGEALLCKIQESEELKHLSHYPAVLLMMATLWHFLPSFANSVTGFYQDYIRYLLGRHEQKYLKSEDRKSYGEIMLVYRTKLLKIGRLAANAMMKNRIELSFPFKDVIEQVGEETWQLGILREESSFLGGRVVVFPHKTLQEFFVSYFIVNCHESERRELLMYFCSSRQSFRESAMIRRFVAGLGGVEIMHQIQTIISGSEEEMAKMHTELQLDYLSEHQTAQLVLPQVMWLTITHKYPGSHFAKYLGQNGMKLEKLTMATNAASHFSLMHYLKSPNLTCLLLQRELTMAVSVDRKYVDHKIDLILQKFPLRQLKLMGLIPTLCLIQILGSVLKKQTLQELSCSYAAMTTLLDTLISHLPDSALRKLQMSVCSLRSQDVAALTPALPDTLTELDISDNWVSDVFAEFVIATNQLCNLKKLNLSDNKLSPGIKRKIRRSLAAKYPDLELLL